MQPWTAVNGADGLSSVERVVKGGWSLRCFAHALPGGGSLVVSPVKDLGEDAHRGLAQVGSPRLLLAPNHFHHLGLPEWTERYPEAVPIALPEWTERYPEAVPIASEQALPRLRRQHPRVTFRPLAEGERLLPAGVSFLVPEGTKTGEVWLRIASPQGVAWVVSDAFFNVLRPVTGFPGVVLRATGTVPGLRIGATFTLLALGDRRRFAAWTLDRLAADRPVALAVGHGEPVLSEHLSDRLAELLRRRLG
jgi:hypothetical protein